MDGWQMFLPAIRRAIALIAGLCVPLGSLAADRPNVLFIACDDMNDWVGFMAGHPDTKTPNMDRLAQRGIVFDRAYCASPICGPSRAAVLTGLKPETSGVYNNQGTYVDYVPDAVALPRFFKDRGYHVMGCGKINHAMGCVVPENYHEFGPDAGAIGGPFTWEELNMNPGEKVERKDIAGVSDEIASGIIKNVYPGKVIARGSLEATLPLNGIDNRIDRPANGYNTFDWGAVTVGDDEMPDGKMASWGEQKLQSEWESPFFLAVGFYRPHQPWYAPAKYFEPFEDRRLALPPTLARDLDDCGEAARQYAHYPWSGAFATVQKHGQWQDAIRGYLASIHFVDAQVGRLLDALDASPHADNTVIVLWSDHGWELGEKEHWGKHSPWEGSMRVPLVIVPPRSMAIPARRSDAFASLLDLYPTLAELCGLEAPSGLDGKSLVPVLRGEKTSVRDHIVTTLGRSTFCVRQGDLKLIRYYDGSEELYDLASDPNEFRNLAAEPSRAAQLEKLRQLVPVDKRYEQFVRIGHLKAAVRSGGEIELYDMLHPKSGIGEQAEVSADYPDVLRRLRDHRRATPRGSRYQSLPEHEPPRVVAIPPADAGRGLVRVSDTEIRHYPGKGGDQFLRSTDNGETWVSADLPASFPGATALGKEAPSIARNPNNGEFLRVEPIYRGGDGEGVHVSSGGLEGTWRSLLGADGKVFLPKGILRTPIWVNGGKRVLIPAHGGGCWTWYSDDQGETWGRSNRIQAPPH